MDDLARTGAMHITVITGATASGKSAEALKRARDDRSIEIVNADAQLLYRGFDIGTAKPTPEERKEVPHHMIDVLEPAASYSAVEYSAAARAAIREIIARGNTPIVVGGTGFYIDALFRGLMVSDISKKDQIEARKQYAEEFEQLGFQTMHERLRPIDPDLHRQIAREMNPIRLERAWTHYYATGVPLGEARKAKRDAFEYEPTFVVLDLPREQLNDRITARIDAMLAAGWLEEVRGLIEQGIDRDAPAMRAIGYQELYDHLDGKRTIEEAREAMLVRTRQYAKRQTTWLRNRQQ